MKVGEGKWKKSLEKKIIKKQNQKTNTSVQLSKNSNNEPMHYFVFPVFKIAR